MRTTRLLLNKHPVIHLYRLWGYTTPPSRTDEYLLLSKRDGAFSLGPLWSKVSTLCGSLVRNKHIHLGCTLDDLPRLGLLDNCCDCLS